ncbi:hypothetical protein PAPYR_9367 [Paratrimastix pyriformis]|uniref:Uncharacterized protein n=1 Tax=Paratrimastix pyriformis TaxID=342808 RepID=A0ABQ8UE31_9EUKA|nr:hypothetical protein PAPYR_9367 [Paratrimastix pyriformis]
MWFCFDARASQVAPAPADMMDFLGLIHRLLDDHARLAAANQKLQEQLAAVNLRFQEELVADKKWLLEDHARLAAANQKLQEDNQKLQEGLVTDTQRLLADTQRLLDELAVAKRQRLAMEAEHEVVRRRERDQAVRLAYVETRLALSLEQEGIRSPTPRSIIPPESSPSPSPRRSPIDTILKPGEKGYPRPTSALVSETKPSAAESTAFEILCTHLLTSALASPHSNPHAPYPTTPSHTTLFTPDGPATAPLRPVFLALVAFREGKAVLDIVQPAPPLPSLPVLRSSAPPDGPRPMYATPPTGVLRPNPRHPEKLSPHAIAMAPAPSPLLAASPTAPASASASESAAVCQNSYVVGGFTLNAETIKEKIFQVAGAVKALLSQKTGARHTLDSAVPLSDLIAYCAVVVRGPLNDEDRHFFHLTAITRGMGAYLEAGRFCLFPSQGGHGGAAMPRSGASHALPSLPPPSPP